MKCPECDGSGALLADYYDTEKGWTESDSGLDCPRCRGTGEVPDAPRFKPGDRVLVPAEIVRVIGEDSMLYKDGYRYQVTVNRTEPMMLMREGSVHPMPEEGE